MQIDFIIGIPRSGTTLLTTRLDTLPGVLALLENRIAISIHKDLHADHVNWKYVDDQLHIIKTQLQTTDYKVEGNPIQSLKDSGSKEAQDAFARFYNHVSGRSLPPHSNVIDKNPNYTWHFNKLKMSYPKSKFVITNRDPRGFILSKRQKRIKDHLIYNVSFLANVWLTFQKEIREIRDTNKDITHYVLYENLTAEPERILKELCSFLSIEYQDSLTEGTEVKLDLSSEREQIRQKDLGRDINASRAFSWKTDLTPNQRRRIEVICRKEMTLQGFETEFQPSGILQAWILFRAFPFRILSRWRVSVIKSKP